jgi:hypothetical protein
VGATGSQGPIGDTGAQGASTAGYAGPTGATGATGEQGATGATGAQGSTLYGPTGSVGRTGASGAPGVNGDMGSQGSTTAGVAGLAGNSGATGAQGSTGNQGDVGVAGIVTHWTSYREYMFAYNDDQIQSSDAMKSSHIAAYMNANPSLILGLDGTMAVNGTDPKDQTLSDNRVEAVRQSLIAAGVPAYKIRTGSFGDETNRRDRRVEVLFISASS